MPRDFAESIAGLDLDPASITSEPTLCDRRLAQMAAFELMPRLIGPGACGGRDLVRLEAVVLADKTRVAIHPAALVNCPMAESLGVLGARCGGAAARQNGRGVARHRELRFVRMPHPQPLGPAPSFPSTPTATPSTCAPLTLADGRRLELTDPKVDKPLRVAWRDAACHRFTTVLGPGDPYHSGHIHLDVIARHNGYRICQWEVRVPAPKPAVPLPRPRPVEASAAPAHPG